MNIWADNLISPLENFVKDEELELIILNSI